MSATQPTILATSIGFKADRDNPHLLRPGPSFAMAAELARAGAAPKVCMIPTAGGENPAYLSAYHQGFSTLGMVSSHLTLFTMPNVPDMRAHLLGQDIIWVGGGSTANLLALWRLHGLDRHLARMLGGRRGARWCLGRIHLLAHRRDHRLLRAPTPDRSPTGWPSCPIRTAPTTTTRRSDDR